MTYAIKTNSCRKDGRFNRTSINHLASLMDDIDTNINIVKMTSKVLYFCQMKALRRSLEGVIRPFTVPGSQVLFTPDIYVTVIAWSPFLCTGAQAVLHQVNKPPKPNRKNL